MTIIIIMIIMIIIIVIAMFIILCRFTPTRLSMTRYGSLIAATDCEGRPECIDSFLRSILFFLVLLLVSIYYLFHSRLLARDNFFFFFAKTHTSLSIRIDVDSRIHGIARNLLRYTISVASRSRVDERETLTSGRRDLEDDCEEVSVREVIHEGVAQRPSTYHVMSRVNDRHHLLVIRVQNFTQAR